MILVTGGEGEVGENGKEAEAKLWVPLVREEMAGGGRSMADRDAAAEVLIGGGAPVVDGRRGVAD